MTPATAPARGGRGPRPGLLAWTLPWLLAACGLGPASSPTGPAPTPVAIIATIAPANTPTAEATAAVAPAPTPIPAPSATPAPALRQLTEGGCCVQPFWSPDGSEVWFIDRPNQDGPGGIYGVSAAGAPGLEPHFVTDRLGVFSPDASLVAFPAGGQTYIERAGGDRWQVPSGGRAISFSPDGSLIAWQTGSSSVNFDRRLVEVWVAQVDGSQARSVAQLIGGGLGGWLPGGRLLVSGRETIAAEPFLASLALADGTLTVLARGDRMRGAAISPGGGWLAYQVTFSGDADRDGLWVVRADGGDPRRLDPYGAYRWRAEGRLLVVPLDPGAGAAGHRLLEVDALSGQARPLTDPAVTPFRIAGGDWSPSPDGQHVAFVSADDRNIWVLDLP